jgi:hypothetical protein
MATKRRLVCDEPFGGPWAGLRVGSAAARWAGATLLVALLVASEGTSATAEPGDFGVEVFSGANYTGNPEILAMDPTKENQRWGRYYKPDWAVLSLKVGKNMGVLLQKEAFIKPAGPPDCVVLTQDTPSLSEIFHHTSHILIFNKGANQGTLPGGKVKWERPRPDGVLMSQYSSNTLVGGVNPEVPHYFFAPIALYPPPYDGAENVSRVVVYNTQKYDLHWAQIWGKTTYLKIRDKVGHEKTYTTDGKDEAEFDLSGSVIFQNLASAEIGLIGGGGASGAVGYDPAASRARWEFKNIRFKQFANGKWVEFQSEKPNFWFTEVERKPDFVEILDKDRNVRVRLYADRITMLNPGYNPSYTPLYAGGGWRDHRDFWRIDPGHYFKKNQDNTWNEFQGDKKAFSFTESKRTPEGVELMDVSRHLWVRLEEKLASIRKEDPAAPWQPLGPGRWDFDEAPQKAAAAPSPQPPAPPLTPPSQPAIPVAADVAGTWVSNVGVEYNMAQSGLNFTWSAPKLSQSGQGNLYAGHKVSATWSGPTGSGSTDGQITHFDAAGKPARIQWNNGVVLTRKTAATPPQPAAINLQGNWVNNFGVVYHFKQTGMTFTWSAPKLNETAQGNVLSGNALNVKWSGSMGSGAAGGKITQFDAQGKPTRIEWSNGAVFTRQ